MESSITASIEGLGGTVWAAITTGIAGGGGSLAGVGSATIDVTVDKISTILGGIVQAVLQFLGF